MTRSTTVIDCWSNAMQLGMIGLESQAVIAMRVWGMGGLWSITDSELDRMVSEKSTAITQSYLNAGLAAFSGKRPDEILAEAIKPVRRKTRANSKRLAKRGPKLR